jgi:GH18 family chitinase
VSNSTTKPTFSSVQGASANSNDTTSDSDNSSNNTTVENLKADTNSSSENVPSNINCDFKPKIIGFHTSSNKSITISALPYLTHVYLFSVNIAEDGTFAYYSGGGRNRWIDIITAAKKQGVKVFATIGGATKEKSGQFSKVFASTTSRATFIKTTMDEAKELGLDGIDIDWEFPKTDADMDNYILVLAELKTKLNAEGKELSVDLDRSPKASAGAKALFKIQLLDAVDFINLMTYDHAQEHAGFEATKFNINEYVDAGVPHSKMSIGVPFYGREGNYVLDYKNIIASYNPSPESDKEDGYYFNGITTMKNKVNYIVDNKMQGMMIWQLKQDLAYTDDRALLPAIHKHFKARCGSYM